MKIAEMKEIAVSYENVTAFLHTADIATFEALTGIECKPGYTFQALANAVIAKYQSKALSNKAATAAIELIKGESTPKIERFRRDGLRVYEYSVGHNCYRFIGNHGPKAFKKMIADGGRFI